MQFKLSSVFHQYLDYYGIDYKLLANGYTEINQNDIFKELVLNNDFFWFEQIAYDINKCFIAHLMESFAKYGSLEMNILFFEKCRGIAASDILLKITASRYDDNLEIFKLYAKGNNFPKCRHYNSLLKYEQSDVLCTAYKLLIIAIEHGNYHIFHHVATISELSKDYIKIQRGINNTMWKLNNLNFKIMDFLLFKIGYSINYTDFRILFDNNQLTTLEYIVDLIGSRKIIIPNDQLKSVMQMAQNKSPEIKELFDCMI
jgi:hypothetical protein